MPLAKQTGKDFKPLPAGSHVARCFGVISLGTQQSPNFPSSFKVMLMFEVPGEVVEMDGKPAPMTIQREYTLSLSEKANLRHDLEGWRGRQFTAAELEGFAVEKVLGQPCMLSVIHKATAKGKTYAAIAAIAGMPKGVTCPPPWHKPIQFEVEEGSASPNYKALPEWVQKKIQLCEEWSAGSSSTEQEHEPEPPADDSDPVPF